MLKVGSTFSGIAGFELGAAATGGFETVFQSEIDPYAQQILKRHFPDVPLIEDVHHVTNETLRRRSIPRPDVIVGGSPCQSFSLAGNREGLAGKSGLWYEFHRIVEELRPRWVVWENVKDVLSSGPPDPSTGNTRRGIDFAIILAGFTGYIPRIPRKGWKRSGFMRGRPGLYSVAWRVLDAQHFGVAQRRRRLFIVASLNSGCCAEVLFERESLRGHSPSRQNTRKGVASAIGTRSTTRGSWRGYDNLVPYRKVSHSEYVPTDLASTVKSRDHKDATDQISCVQSVDVRNLALNDDISGTLQSKENGGYSLNFQNPVIVKIDNTTSNGWGVLEDGTTHTLGGSTDAVAYAFQQAGDNELRFANGDGQIAATVTSNSSSNTQRNLLLEPEYIIRRFTPVENERLQGFPDGWTDGLSDTQRYRLTGNAVVPAVIEWIARRLLMAEQKHRMSHGKPSLFPLLCA